MQENQLNQEIGRRLIEMRKLRGLTQRDVGRVLGVSAQQIRKYEIGINSISAGNLFRLSKFFKVSIRSFFEGDTVFPEMAEAIPGGKSPTTDTQFQEFMQLYIALSKGDRKRIIRTLKAWTEEPVTAVQMAS